MFIPLDPTKIKDFWDIFKKYLIINKNSYLIINGEKNNDTLEKIIDLNTANELIMRMKKSDYIRLGSNRNLPIPVHFAINFSNKEKGKLVEMISVNDSMQQLQNDLSLIIQLVFFEASSLIELSIPMIVDGINEPNVKIITDPVKQNMIVKRLS